MRGADREDAIKVSITRDGKVYLGTEQVWLPDLPAKIQDRPKDREVERKVYSVADMRARWGGVKLVLDGVRSAGIIRVAILADQGRLPNPSRWSKSRAAPDGQLSAAVPTLNFPTAFQIDFFIANLLLCS
jgi:hypothetical protein